MILIEIKIAHRLATIQFIAYMPKVVTALSDLCEFNNRLAIRLVTLPKFVNKLRFLKLAFTFVHLRRVRFTRALAINV